MAGPAAFLFVWTMSGSERPCTTESPLDEVADPARSISRDDRRRRGSCVVYGAESADQEGWVAQARKPSLRVGFVDRKLLGDGGLTRPRQARTG